MRIRRAGSDKGTQVAAALDGAAELLFQAHDLLGDDRADAGGAGELVAVAEDAELAGAAPPAHVVAWMDADAVALDDSPDFGFLPVADGPVAVDMAGHAAVTQVGTVRLPDGVLSALWRFLTTLAGEDEGADTLKSRLVGDGRRTDIDLEVRTAPAGTQVGGGLGETEPGARMAPCAAGAADGAVGKFVAGGSRAGGSRAGVIAHHLAVETALFPLEVDLHTEGLGEAPAVVGGDLPVEEGALTSVNVLMPKLDAVPGNALVEQVQKSGGRILTATETYDVPIVVMYIVFHDLTA